MRCHPQISCEILEQAGGVFYLLAHIVVAHHERWDGRGYPAGLAQEAIPISARIISVVDSYDAMTSPRVYREPLTAEQAKEELRRCAGSQFDPTVVEVFLDELDQPGSAVAASSHEQDAAWQLAEELSDRFAQLLGR